MDPEKEKKHIKDIKKFVALSGKTIGGLEKELNLMRGRISAPLSRGRIRHEIVLRMAKACGLKLKWVNQK